MYKRFAEILICAVCLWQVTHGLNAGVIGARGVASGAQIMDPVAMDAIGYQIGTPLMAPYAGPWPSLYAASLNPRSFTAQSNPILTRGPCADNFIGESRLGMLAV